MKKITEAKIDALFKDMAKDIVTLKGRIEWLEENFRANFYNKKTGEENGAGVSGR